MDSLIALGIAAPQQYRERTQRNASTDCKGWQQQRDTVLRRKPQRPITDRLMMTNAS